MNHGRRLVTASFITLTVLAGCGGSDDPPETDASSDAETTTSVAGSDAPATTRAQSSGGLGMGAETWAKQLKVALQADDYTVDGNTVTVILADGTTADGDSDCGVAGATAGTNVTVVISYPDGDVAC